MAGASAGGYLTRFGNSLPSGAFRDLAVAIALPVVWVLAGIANRAYDRRFFGAGTTEFRRVGRTFLSVLAVIACVSYVADLQLARAFVMPALGGSLLAVCGGRALARIRLIRRRRTGKSMQRIVLAGRAASLRSLAATLRQEPSAGLDVIGACLPEDEALDAGLRKDLAEAGVPVLGALAEIRDVVLHHAADGVAVVSGDVSSRAIRSISWDLENVGAELIVSTGLADVAADRVHVQSVGGTPVLRVDSPRFEGARRVVKGAFDRVVAAVALILLAPLLVTLGLMVRCTSRGPAFYLQERVGRNGSRFRMVKFRSMYTGAHERVAEFLDHNTADGPLFKIKDDPRVTSVGKWMRKFSLDELPQLLNVLTGSMSLVGPRPPLPSEVEMYQGDVHRRLLVKPGLTGLWQVSGRSDLCWEDSVRLDLHYVENWSLAMDFRLLLRTAGVVLKAKGAY